MYNTARDESGDYARLGLKSAVNPRLTEINMAITSADIDSPVQFLKGVGPKRAELLKKLGVETIGDMLLFFPMRYEDRSKIKTISEINVDELETVRAEVKSALSSRRGRRRVFEIAFADKTGVLRATWFHFSEKAYAKKFKPGSEWIVSGKVTLNRYRGSKEMIHPQVEDVGGAEAGESLHTGRIVPIYNLTEGLTQRAVRAATHAAAPYADVFTDFVPDELNARYKLPPLAESIRRAHWPEEGMSVQKLLNFQTREQKKLIFNEFFLIQAGLAIKRRGSKKEVEGIAMKTTPELMEKIYSVLPFSLTPAQQRVLREISGDVGSDSPMNRLLQGDVGSGKTAVALSAALIAVRNKKQAAVMAPTEILATQHFKNFKKLLKGTKVRIELLTGGMKKEKIYEAIAAGDVHIVVGTHALIQEQVSFHSLGLVIIDEQHRFGVRQRAELIRKGASVHTLIMTATPIPRTLAMTLYGDLDVSVIDELPPGRAPVKTMIFRPDGRARAMSLIRDEVKKGRQAYIIYPLVEESEKLELKAATAMFERLSGEDLFGLRLGLTHGRMKSADKEEVMEKFSRREIDALVSTTVIEVGIDQPNASVMMIEHAERFGLSQLHQLRGRVGRGEHESYCLLMTDAAPGTPAWNRLRVMEKYTDGFKIAEEDLAMRGAGDFFGEKQTGLPEFKIGDILRDYRILAEARKAAFEIVESDPALAAPRNKNLRAALKRHWRGRFELGEIG